MYQRDPWAAHLRLLDGSGLEFALLAIHTPPSDAEAEILAMSSVLEWAATSVTPNVILVGDYNGDGNCLSDLSIDLPISWWPRRLAARYP